jgi:hypothetical protein
MELRQGMPVFRHVYLAQPTHYDVEVLVMDQRVSYLGTKFVSAWSAPAHFLGPILLPLPWEVADSDAELQTLVERAAPAVPADGYVLVVHAPAKLAMAWSDKPIPPVDPSLLSTIGPPFKTAPLQAVTDGPSPAWWPNA